MSNKEALDIVLKLANDRMHVSPEDYEKPTNAECFIAIFKMEMYLKETIDEQ